MSCLCAGCSAVGPSGASVARPEGSQVSHRTRSRKRRESERGVVDRSGC
jgi:hypothetical protein